MAARLWALNVLYDEDEHGRYFQIHTRVFAERCFFEIVQREGHQGFGAFTAMIHLAAQEQLSRHPSMPRCQAHQGIARAFGRGAGSGGLAPPFARPSLTRRAHRTGHGAGRRALQAHIAKRRAPIRKPPCPGPLP